MPHKLAVPDAQKIEQMMPHIFSMMEILGLDLTDDSLKDTPERIARMYVTELFAGLKAENKPRVSDFENKYQYNKMLVERNIAFRSMCEHHFMPMVGQAHVAYISKGRVIGLSKINRIVDYYARRPQVQERVTLQVLHELQRNLNTQDVAVLIEAQHLCVSHRGVGHPHSNTITMEYGGRFYSEKDLQAQFLELIRH